MNAVSAMHPTMSSREIADLVEARHNDVVTTITRLFEKGLLRSSRKTRSQSTGGRPIEVYDLIERDTHLVVAGYSDEHRARVIDRWQELEEEVGTAAYAKSSLNDSAIQFSHLVLHHLPNLGNNSKQALLSHVSEIAFGQRLIPLPRVEEHLMPAKEVGEILGISANMVGRIANANELKQAPYGEFRLDKAAHSHKQVESFFYSAAGVERLKELCEEIKGRAAR